MTGNSFSKKNFILHDSKMVLKKNIGWILLAVFVFLILIPFSTAGIPGDSIWEITTTHEQMKFRFLMKKDQCTFYFSLGITRGKLYFVRLCIGLLGMFFTVFIPMAVSFFVNYMALGYYPGMTACCLFVSVGLFLQGGVAFLTTALACILAGTLKEALIFDGLFLGVLSCLFYSADKLLQNLVWGNSAGAMYYAGNKEIASSLSERMQGINPLCFFYQNLKKYNMFYQGLTEVVPEDFHISLLCGWSLVLGLLIFFGWILIRCRKAEQSEMEMFYKFLHNIFIFVISLTVFSEILVLFYENNEITAGLLGILSAALFLILWQKIVWRQEKNRMVIWKSGICMIAIGVTVVFFVTCFNVSYRNLPKETKIKKVSVSYVGHPSYLYEETEGASFGSGFYMNTLYDFTEEEDIHQILSFHQKMRELGMQKKEYHKGDFADAVVPYDICFIYELEDGKTKTWYYDRASLSILEKMLYMDEMEPVKEGIQTVINGTAETENTALWAAEAYRSGRIYLSDIWYAHPYELEMDETERKEFLQALAQDVGNQTVESRYFPEEEALGAVLFTTNGEADLDTFSYQLGNAIIYITEEFTNTLRFIEENQWEECIAFEGDIESITLQAYNPYDGINGRKSPLSNLFLSYRQNSLDAFLVQEDYGAKRSVTDEKRISELLPKLRSVYNMTRGGYLAAVKISGQDGYIYKYLPGDL